MPSNTPSRPGRCLASIAVAVLSLVQFQVSAADFYWDGNDATNGFGTASGTWTAPTVGTTTSGWSTSSAGSAVVNGSSVTTSTNDVLYFGTATDGLATGTITLSGTNFANALVFGSASGLITLSGGALSLGGTTPPLRHSSFGANVGAWGKFFVLFVPSPCEIPT